MLSLAIVVLSEARLLRSDGCGATEVPALPEGSQPIRLSLLNLQRWAFAQREAVPNLIIQGPRSLKGESECLLTYNSIRECGKDLGQRPRSFCEDCFSPLEVAYDYDSLKKSPAAKVLPARLQYVALCRASPLPRISLGQTRCGNAAGASRKLASRWGLKNLYFKNDAVCFPSLSFKDRVVATALSAARRFNFTTVGCSSTGNLANAVAAQAAQQGFDACVFIPPTLSPPRCLNTAVYGARIVRINGNYDHVNRCARRSPTVPVGTRQRESAAVLFRRLETHGYEIAEQLGWTLPDNVVVPMAGGLSDHKDAKAFRELVTLGWVEAKPVKFFGAQATGCSPISDGVKRNLARFEPQKPIPSRARSPSAIPPTDPSR